MPIISSEALEALYSEPCVIIELNLVIQYDHCGTDGNTCEILFTNFSYGSVLKKNFDEYTLVIIWDFGENFSTILPGKYIIKNSLRTECQLSKVFYDFIN